MAVYDLEEQEQIAALKAWWKENGRTIILAVVVFVASLGGVQGWRYYQQQQALGAAAAYQALEQALAGSDPKKIADAAAFVKERFPKSPYAARAALAWAKAGHQAGDLGRVRSELQWALDNTLEEGVRDAARLRLARLALEEKKYDQALQLLQAKHQDSFAALYADLRGDVLLAQGEAAQARAAYQQALAKADPAGALHGIVQLKLDALGGAK